MANSSGVRLELDFFIEELNVAIEVQGIQHVEYVPFFHNTYNDFLERKKRDEEKIAICYRKEIDLYHVYTFDDADRTIKRIFFEAKEIDEKALEPPRQDDGPTIMKKKGKGVGIGRKLPKGKIRKAIQTIIMYQESNPEIAKTKVDEIVDIATESNRCAFNGCFSGYLKRYTQRYGKNMPQWALDEIAPLLSDSPFIMK